MAEPFSNASSWTPVVAPPAAAKSAKAAAMEYGGGPMPGPEILRYPLNVGVGDDQGHWIIFNIFKHDPSRLLVNRVKGLTSKDIGEVEIGGGVFRAKAEALLKKQGQHTGPNSIQVKQMGKPSIAGTIGLYMPPSISVTYGAKYADQDIGRAAEAGAGAIAAFSQSTDFWSVAGGIARSALGALPGKGIEMILKSLPAGTKTVAEIATGAIIAPRMELMFEGMNRRNFSFSFQFVPKNNTESLVVKRIVEKFKYHMSSDYSNPSSEATLGGSYTGGSDGVRNMTIPDFFGIEYMYYNNTNKFLNKIKTCALQSMNVSYGDDRYKSYAGGEPQTTKLSLTFQELEIITKKYIQDGF